MRPKVIAVRSIIDPRPSEICICRCELLTLRSNYDCVFYSCFCLGATDVAIHGVRVSLLRRCKVA